MRAGRRRWALLGVVGLLPAPAAAVDSLTVFAGPFTSNHWEDFFLSPGGIDFRDAWLVGVAPAWRLARPTPRWSLELEAQLGRYVGDQRNWEVNALVAARYRLHREGAPVRASLAFGIGPSWASKEPVLERHISDNGDSARWLVYWYLEAAGAPRSWGPWRAVLRLHHRSGAYGYVAEAGGSNTPTLGIRRRF